MPGARIQQATFSGHVCVRAATLLGPWRSRSDIDLSAPPRRHRGGDHAGRRGPRRVDRGRLRDDPLPPRARRRRRPARQADAPAPRASSPTPRSPATTGRALPGAAAVELGHNFSLVHDDIEDGDVERRHRPTLWALHGVPQAINTGDLIFSLSRVALHRLTDLGFSDTKVLRLMRLYDETCVLLCEGQYLDIATLGVRRADVGRALLRHDRPQDGGPDLGLDRGGGAAGDRRRRGHRALPAVRLVARASRSRSTTTCSASGAEEQRRARSRRTSPATRRRCRCCTRSSTANPGTARRLSALYADPDPDAATSPRSSTSSNAPAPASTPAPRPAAIATRPWPSWPACASSTPPLASSWRDHQVGDQRLAQTRGVDLSDATSRRRAPFPAWTLVAWLVVVAVFLVTRLAFLDRDLPPWNLAMYQPIDESAYTIPAFNLHHYGTGRTRTFLGPARRVADERGPEPGHQLDPGLDWTYWGFRASSVLFGLVVFLAILATVRHLVRQAQDERLALPFPGTAILGSRGAAPPGGLLVPDGRARRRGDDPAAGRGGIAAVARRPGNVPRARAVGDPQPRPRPAHRARRRVRVHLQRVHAPGRAAGGRRVGLEPPVAPRRRPSRRPRGRRHGARRRALLRLGLPRVRARPWRLVRHLALDVPGGRSRRHLRPHRPVGPRPRQHLPPRPAAAGALADHASRVRLVGPPEPGSPGHHVLALAVAFAAQATVQSDYPQRKMLLLLVFASRGRGRAAEVHDFSAWAAADARGSAPGSRGWAS